MLPEEFFATRVVIVSGKGGVGKTTIAASLALVAARSGRKVCLVEIDQKGSVPKIFGRGRVGYEPSEIFPDVWAISVVPEDALMEYLDVQYHMKRLSKAFSGVHFIDYITTAAPGLKDILVLGKIWYLEQGRAGGGSKQDFDLIVVDAPAAGHLVTFLSAPLGLSDAVRVGPVRRQAEWLLEMLRDPRRTRVHLVTLAEEMPVSETLETATALRKQIQVEMGAIFANQVYSEAFTPGEEEFLKDIRSDGSLEELLVEGKSQNLDLDPDDLEALVGYADFLSARRTIQMTHLEQLRESAAEPVVELPFLFAAQIGLAELEQLADAIEERLGKL
ncbi:MAG: ArsA family ATPase [Actinomycetota bacterium]|nr:ArsA family ATPase [Actinomycetota bacterium]